MAATVAAVGEENDNGQEKVELKQIVFVINIHNINDF